MSLFKHLRKKEIGKPKKKRKLKKVYSIDEEYEFFSGQEILICFGQILNYFQKFGY